MEIEIHAHEPINEKKEIKHLLKHKNRNTTNPVGCSKNNTKRKSVEL